MQDNVQINLEEVAKAIGMREISIIALQDRIASMQRELDELKRKGEEKSED